MLGEISLQQHGLLWQICSSAVDWQEEIVTRQEEDAEQAEGETMVQELKNWFPVAFLEVNALCSKADTNNSHILYPSRVIYTPAIPVLSEKHIPHHFFKLPAHHDARSHRETCMNEAFYLP